MFFVVTVQDRIPISASYLDKQEWAVEEGIKRKYVDKIIKGSGLCVSVRTVLEVRQAKLMYGDGTAHFEVKFSLIVFRPLKGELLQGEIVASDNQGLQISVGFFDQIHLPPHLLHPHCSFLDELSVWQTDLKSESATRWTYAVGSKVLFRVKQVTFASSGEKKESNSLQSSHPMSVIASVSEPGLGVIGWW